MARVSARISAGHGPAATSYLPSMDLAGRLGKVRAAMEKSGCPALFVSHLVNIRYLTGFSGSAAKLFVTADDAVLLTDDRYRERAAGEMERSGARAGAATSASASATTGADGPREGVRLFVTGDEEQWGYLGELARQAGKVALEADHISWGRQVRLAQNWSDCELVATYHLIEDIRLVKDGGELARVEAAAGVADAALEEVRSLLDESLTDAGGPTEAEIALALDSHMRKLGAVGPAFDTIVAAGPGAAEPHHQAGSRHIRRGDVVVIDFGAEVDGYRSDMTRTIVAGGGEPGPHEMERVMAVVDQSQAAGLAAVRAGARAADVDAACRSVLEAAGMGKLFVHGTGHGVGLDIHEAPWLAARSTDILQAGQVVTVEPGAYLPGVGGARIEDTVVVTEDGCRALTLTPK